MRNLPAHGICVLHVLDDAVITGSAGSEMCLEESSGVRMARLKAAQERLAHRVTPPGPARFRETSEVVFGAFARTIAEYAAANGFDLIVMGTHGRGGVAHLLMGSIAEIVVRTASCPVLTVREDWERASGPVRDVNAVTATA